MSRQAQSTYEFGPFRLDAAKRLLLREGEVVQLTPKCYEILLAFVESSGEVVSKDHLIERVWPDSFVEEGNLTYNISILRKVLGERAGEHEYIVTIPGRGYQFVASVREPHNGVAEKWSEPAAARVETAARKRMPDESFINRVVRDKSRAVIVATVVIMAVAAFGFALFKLISGRQPLATLPAGPFQKVKLTRLTTTGNATVAAISPDGKYVVHAMGGRTRQSLWLRHVATGSDKEIVPTAQVDYTALTFSPDGNYIYFLRAESAEPAPLYRLAVLGDPIQKLADDVDAAITFSPDGGQIAYIRGYPERDEAALITANADGTNEQTLLTKRPIWDVLPPRPEKAWIAWGPAWSPDGSVIAFPLRKDGPDGKYWSVMTVRLKDHAEQQITFKNWSSLGQITWLSDGSGLIAAAADTSHRDEQLWHVSYPNGDVRRITNDTNRYSGVRLTADSAALVTVRAEQNSNIWVAPEADAGRAAQITSDNLEGMNSLSWTPDGRVVYTTRARGFSDISIANADGTGQKQLTVDARDNHWPSVSRDGRYVVFISNRKGSRCLWRMDIDGSNPKQLTYEGVNTGTPDVTPDIKWVVYWQAGSGKKGLWKVSIEGGTPVQLTDYVTRQAEISPDGSKILSILFDQQQTPKRWRIALIPIGGGPPAKVLDLPQTPLGQMVRWTADGRALTYIDSRNGVDNIWAQTLDGSAPRQLTNFTTDLIFAYAWSPDGKRVACARGNQTSDVVLIEALK